MTPRPPPAVDQKDPLAREIQEVLDDDLAHGARLMQAKYRNNALSEGTLNGYCAAATAAYFHLGGGREAGLQPMQHTDHRGDSHWWIVKGGQTIVDLVYRYDEEPHYRYYQRGAPKGFTNCGYVRVPKRAQEIVDRVRARRQVDDHRR